MDRALGSAAGTQAHCGLRLPVVIVQLRAVTGHLRLAPWGAHSELVGLATSGLVGALVPNRRPDRTRHTGRPPRGRLPLALPQTAPARGCLFRLRGVHLPALPQYAQEATTPAVPDSTTATRRCRSPAALRPERHPEGRQRRIVEAFERTLQGLDDRRPDTSATTSTPATG